MKSKMNVKQTQPVQIRLKERVITGEGLRMEGFLLKERHKHVNARGRMQLEKEEIKEREGVVQ